MSASAYESGECRQAPMGLAESRRAGEKGAGRGHLPSPAYYVAGFARLTSRAHGEPCPQPTRSKERPRLHDCTTAQLHDGRAQHVFVMELGE